MKKTIFSAIVAFGLMLSAPTVWSQNSAPAFVKTPDKTQGYFVFNKQQYQNVVNWTVTIEQKFGTGEDAVWKAVQVIKTAENFVRLPQEYVSNNNMKAVVRGLDANGIVSTETDWQPSNGGAAHILQGKVKCIGATYVWELHVYDKVNEAGQPTGQGVYEFTSGVGPVRGFNQAHHINWLVQNHENSPINSVFSSNHYGYNKWVHGTGVNYHGAVNAQAYFTMNNVTLADNIRDEIMTLRTGTVQVVTKAAGQWTESIGHSFETPYTGSQALSQLSYAPSAWLPLINQKPGINCACNPIPPAPSNGGNGGSGSGSGNPWEHLNALLAKYGKWIEDNYDNPIRPVFPSMEAMRDEFSRIEGYEHDNDIPWWPANEISHVLVFPVSADGQFTLGEPIVQISKDLVVNSDGTINSYNFSLNPGLYTVKMYVQNHGFVDAYFEVEEQAVQSYPLSNYLDVNIFPVPLSSNQTLTVVANSNFSMNYTYTLTTEDGRVLDTRVIRSRADEQVRILHDSNSLPNGQLFHKFVFSDGSEVVYNTIKM